MSIPSDETTFYPAIEQSERLGTWSGTNVPRKEDKRLLKGQGAFVDDLWMHRQGHVHFVRSPYAHARITAIDVSRCEAVPGVYATLTGEEVGELQQPYFQMAPEPAGAMKDYCMAVGKARYMGEPVAAVLAESAELARDAAELIEVSYEPLPVVIDGVATVEPDAPLLHEEIGSNIGWQGTYDYGDIDWAIENADHVVRIDRLHFHRFSSTPLETQRRARELGPGNRGGRVPDQQPDADVCRDVHRAGDRARHRPHAVLEPGHRRRLRDQDHQLHLPDRARPALAQGGPPGQVERDALGASRGLGPRKRTHLPRHRGAGDERRHDPRLQGPGVRRRRRVSALRATGGGDLGAGRAGQLPLQARSRRLHRDADEQVPGRTQSRLLATAASVDDRADRRHRGQRARLRSRSSCASSTTSSPRTSRTKPRTAASTTPATIRRCSIRRSR